MGTPDSQDRQNERGEALKPSVETGVTGSLSGVEKIIRDRLLNGGTIYSSKSGSMAVGWGESTKKTTGGSGCGG